MVRRALSAACRAVAHHGHRHMYLHCCGLTLPFIRTTALWSLPKVALLVLQGKPSLVERLKRKAATSPERNATSMVLDPTTDQYVPLSEAANASKDSTAAAAAVGEAAGPAPGSRMPANPTPADAALQQPDAAAAAQQPVDLGASDAAMPSDGSDMDLFDGIGSDSDDEGSGRGSTVLPQHDGSSSGLPAAAFNEHSRCPLVRVSLDGKEADFAYSFRFGRQRKQRWGFIGFRFTQFAGGMELCGWCKDGLCAGAQDRLYDLLEGVDKPEQHKAAWLGDTAQRCACSQQLLHSLGGQDCLQQLISGASAALRRSGDSMITQLPQRGMHRAVRAGNTFASWGMVDADDRCCSCASSQRRCQHAQLVAEQPQPPAGAHTASDWQRWEKKLAKEHHFETGVRRSTRLSKQQLPEDLRDDPVLLRIDSGEQASSTAAKECAICTIALQNI